MDNLCKDAFPGHDTVTGCFLYSAAAVVTFLAYLRYLENVLRSALGLDGVPIRVIIRGRKR